MTLRFSEAYITNDELKNMATAIANQTMAGDGEFTKKCEQNLKTAVGAKEVLMTNSCTSALEMAAILTDAGPEGEYIMPSFTFVSTANAFLLQQATPVFIDIRKDTLNIDETLIEEAITEKTKGIVAVHYAGVACEMDKILEIGRKHNIPVIEDAAQGMNSFYKKRHLGSMGDMGTVSFHQTKNISCGEGGALCINNPDYVDRSFILREKGTNRKQFMQGQVDKYTWVDIGSSYLQSDLQSAFLLAQLEHADVITEKRRAVYDAYLIGLSSICSEKEIQLPQPPSECEHNAHIFHLILPTADLRDRCLKKLRGIGVPATFHYIPLHSTEFGLSRSRSHGKLAVTEDLPYRLIRLPLHSNMTEDDVNFVLENCERVFNY